MKGPGHEWASDAEGADDFELGELTAEQYRRIFPTVKMAPLPPRQAKRYLLLIFLLMGAVLLYQFVYPAWREEVLNESRNSTARNHLRRLILAQEQFYLEDECYAGGLADLGSFFSGKEGVVVQFLHADKSSWSAYVFHRDSPVKYLYESERGGFMGAFDRKTGERVAPEGG
ncbi:MAG: hypothetical protein V1816_04370 [Pseudomonadota bacterium]